MLILILKRLKSTPCSTPETFHLELDTSVSLQLPQSYRETEKYKLDKTPKTETDSLMRHLI